MELSGHKDTSMLKRYGHTQEEAKKAAIAKFGNRLRSLDMDNSSDTSPQLDKTRASNMID